MSDMTYSKFLSHISFDNLCWSIGNQMVVFGEPKADSLNKICNTFMLWYDFYFGNQTVVHQIDKIELLKKFLTKLIMSLLKFEKESIIFPFWVSCYFNANDYINNNYIILVPIRSLEAIDELIFQISIY